MTRGKFTMSERAYLESLPVVSRVTEDRIYYTTAFRDECMQRYWDGESPTQIFRENGLDPSLIGRKRIERCISRWRVTDMQHAGFVLSRRRPPIRGRKQQKEAMANSDLRIIALQACRIQELEDQIQKLEEERRRWRTSARIDGEQGATGNTMNRTSEMR